MPANMARCCLNVELPRSESGQAMQFDDLPRVSRNPDPIFRAKSQFKEDLNKCKTLMPPLGFAFHVHNINENIRLALDEAIIKASKRKELGIENHYYSMYNADVASQSFQRTPSTILSPPASSFICGERAEPAFVRPRHIPSLYHPLVEPRPLASFNQLVTRREDQNLPQNHTLQHSHSYGTNQGFLSPGFSCASYDQNLPSFSGVGSSHPCWNYPNFENFFKPVVKIGPMPGKYKYFNRNAKIQDSSSSDDDDASKKEEEKVTESTDSSSDNEIIKKKYEKYKKKLESKRYSLSDLESASSSESSDEFKCRTRRRKKNEKTTKISEAKGRKKQRVTSLRLKPVEPKRNHKMVKPREKKKVTQPKKNQEIVKPKKGQEVVEPKKTQEIVKPKKKEKTEEPKKHKAPANEVCNWSLKLENRNIVIVGESVNGSGEKQDVSLVVESRDIYGKIKAKTGLLYTLKGPMHTNSIPKEIAKKCRNGLFPVTWRKLQKEWNNLSGKESSNSDQKQVKKQIPYHFADLGIDLDKYSGCMTPTSLLSSIKKPVMNDRCTPPTDSIEDFLLQPKPSTSSHVGPFFISPERYKNGVLMKRAAKVVTDKVPKMKKKKITETNESPESKEDVDTIMEALKVKGQTPPLVKQVFRGEVRNSDNDDNDDDIYKDDEEVEEHEDS